MARQNALTSLTVQVAGSSTTAPSAVCRERKSARRLSRFAVSAENAKLRGRRGTLIETWMPPDVRQPQSDGRKRFHARPPPANPGVNRRVSPRETATQAETSTCREQPGEVTERPIVQHWKCCVSEMAPGVRIPPSPLTDNPPAVTSFAAGGCVFSVIAHFLSVLKTVLNPNWRFSRGQRVL